jgi:hypothetical protein
MTRIGMDHDRLKTARLPMLTGPARPVLRPWFVTAGVDYDRDLLVREKSVWKTVDKIVDMGRVAE